MKNKIIIYCCFFSTLTFYAQQDKTNISLEVKMTDVFEDNHKKTTLAFSTNDNDEGVYIGRRYKKGYYIEHFDKSLHLVKSYDFEIDKRRGKIDNAFLSGDNLCLIESVYNKKGKKIEYFINKTPKDTFLFQRNLLFSIPLDDVKKSVSFFGLGLNKTDADASGNFKISQHQKYIVFTIDIKDKGSETHRIFVFNNALEKIYQTEFKRGVKDRNFKLENIDIDEKDGTVYLLGKVYAKENKKKKQGGKYQFELYKIKGNSTQSLVFDSSERYIGSLTTVINKDKLFCIGFYSEKNDKRYKGVAYFDVDQGKMALTNKVYSPFTKQFIVDKYGKEKEKELKNISFRSVHITKNNEYIINAEEFFIRAHQLQNQQGSSFNYTYHFRDIVSVKIDVKGKLVWARNINKKQADNYYSPYLSYTSIYHDSKSYFFINCSDKIKKLSNDRLQFKGTKIKNSNFYVITLDANGSFEYKKIVDDEDAEVPFAVGNGILNKDQTEIVFQGRRGSKKQIMKVSL